jgi:hypothetical protein
MDAYLVFLGFLMPPLYHLFGALREERENHRIVNLLESGEDGRQWQSIHEISSRTNIPEDRVKQLCRRPNRIRRSEHEQEMWRLADRRTDE